MRYLLSLVLLLALPFAALSAEENHCPPVPEAPAWYQDPGLTFKDRWAQAIKENQPMAVWVGYWCESSINRIPGFIHHKHDEDSFRGRNSTVEGPAVVILTPKGDGNLWWYKDISVVHAEDCCAGNMKRAVEATLARFEADEARRRAEAQRMMAPPPVRTVVVPARQVRGWMRASRGFCAS